MDYIPLINRFWYLATTNPFTTGQVSLYFALLHVCNSSYWQEWFAAPNQVLSVLTGLSRSGILKARNELKQRGIIDFKERGTKATQYRITMSNSTQDSVQVSAQNSVQARVQVGVQESEQAKYSIYNTINIQKDKRQKTKDRCAKKPAEAIPQDTLERYIASMEALGKPLTSASLEMLFKRLEELAPGDTAKKTAILDQSIRKRWKDVYPLQDDEPEKERTGRQKGGSANRFKNFEERTNDYESAVYEQIRKRSKGGEACRQEDRT